MAKVTTKNPKGAGRPKGAINKKTAELIETCKETGQTPVEYMLSVMRDVGNDTNIRLDAANKVAPYIHPKLSQIESKQEVELDGQKLVESFSAAILNAANVNKKTT